MSRALLVTLCALAVASCGGGGDGAQPPPAENALGCRGSGAPTVVFESGLGVDPSTWAAVTVELDAMRVCLHERSAGLSRTAAAIATKLDVLLEDRPVVLVGASFGGYVVQLFASRHPADVAGVVLVDSLHPDIDTTFERLFGKRAAAARARQLASNSEGITFADLRRSAAEVEAAEGFPDVPLVVLKHGISFDPGGEPVPALERAWGRMQARLAALSPQGRVLTARRSHHRIAEDQPGLVATAIRRVAQAVPSTQRRAAGVRAAA
jgi:pimeloyl-ACP methyl ester carboxylesterase